MKLTIQTPHFISELMKLWIIQHVNNQQDKITQLGLFHWDFSPNKRNPEKPRRIPRIDYCKIIKEETFKRSIYFFELDTKTLHVLESSGIALAGLIVANEYVLEHNKFIKKRELLKMIQ